MICGTRSDTVTTIYEQTPQFHMALSAAGRAPEIPEPADIYATFLGSWELDVYDYQRDGSIRRSNGEVHFARVLEGRAMQLVWAIPRRAARSSDLPKTGNRYGTTLCVWDPAIQAWHVTWINPVSGVRTELVGRRSGQDIVQIGTHADGTPVRWNFSEVTRDSFRWTGEALQPDGKTWMLEVEFRASRTSENGPSERS
jgi:hypothetical protein